MYMNKQLIFCGNLIFYTYFSGKFHIGVDESNRCMCMCVWGGGGGEGRGAGGTPASPLCTNT